MSRVAATQRLRAVVALGAGPDPMVVEAAVSGASALEVIGFMHDLDAESGRLEELAPDILIVACSEECADEVTELIAQFPRRHPKQSVLVLGSATLNGL